MTYVAQFLLWVFSLCEHQTEVKKGHGAFVSHPFLNPQSLSSSPQPFVYTPSMNMLIPLDSLLTEETNLH